MNSSEGENITKPVVLIIDSSIGLTGALKSIVRTSSILKEAFTFQFIVPRNSKGRSWVAGAGFPQIDELPMVEISRRFGSLLLYFSYLIFNAIRLKQILTSKKVSLIHVNDLYNLLPVVLKILGSRVPYVCHIRFLPDRFPKWIFRLWLGLHFRYASRIVVVSRAQLAMLPPHPKLTLIPGELPAGERHLDFQEQPKRTFLYLSNFMRGKGQDFAIAAFARIQSSLPEWKLKLVGSDFGLKRNKAYRSELESLVKKLGVSANIEWSPFTEDVELEYKKAGIVLNFSESESFSMTCLEALYFRKPLIASDCGGPSEIIEDGVTGMLVPNRDVNAMAVAMKELAGNEKLRMEMGVKAGLSVREKFSVNHTSLKLGEVYHKALMPSL